MAPVWYFFLNFFLLLGSDLRCGIVFSEIAFLSFFIWLCLIVSFLNIVGFRFCFTNEKRGLQIVKKEKTNFCFGAKTKRASRMHVIKCISLALYIERNEATYPNAICKGLTSKSVRILRFHAKQYILKGICFSNSRNIRQQ